MLSHFLSDHRTNKEHRKKRGSSKEGPRLCSVSVIDTSHGREQDDVADGGAVGQQHDQAVNAVADASRRRHADVQRVQEILVRVLGFFIARLGKGILRLEALALVDRIVQLGVGIAHLAGSDGP